MCARVARAWYGRAALSRCCRLRKSSPRLSTCSAATFEPIVGWQCVTFPADGLVGIHRRPCWKCSKVPQSRGPGTCHCTPASECPGGLSGGALPTPLALTSKRQLRATASARATGLACGHKSPILPHRPMSPRGSVDVRALHACIYQQVTRAKASTLSGMQG